MPSVKATSQNFTKSVLGDIEGDKIATIGVGTSEGLLPKSGTNRIDGLSIQTAPEIFKALGGDDSVALDGTITLDEIGFSSSTHNFDAGDRILFSQDQANADWLNFMVGLVTGRHYFAIPVDSTSFKLARTQADATASTPVPITFGSTRTGTATAVPIFHFENLSKIPVNNPSIGKIQNALFDYGTKNPNQVTLNAYPLSSDHNEDIDFTTITGIETVPYWRRYSGLLINGAFLPYPGTEWLTNEDPYKRVEDDVRQAKVLSLYGSSTLLPNNIGYANTGGYNGFYNVNDKANQVAGHTVADVTNLGSQSVLAGNSNFWVRHEWYQQVKEAGKIVRANGKIKFGVKCRQPDHDNMRLNDFAGMYVKLEYPTALNRKGVAIGYFKIQRRDSTGITLCTGSPTNIVQKKTNWHGASINAINQGDDQRTESGYSSYPSMTIQELDTVYAEDIRNFEEIEVEMDIPSDFMPLVYDDYYRSGNLNILNSNVGNDYLDSIAISVGLYYSDNCGNLMGMEGADGTAEDNNYSTVNVGERVFLNQSPTGTTAQAMGYEYDGTVFTDFNSTTIPRGSLLRKKNAYLFTADTRDVINDTQIRSNGLVAGDPYFIDSLDGITQAEMHELAGTVPGEEIPAEYMIPGETYTISVLGSGSWGAINVQNEAFPQFSIGPTDNQVGYAFKFKGYSSAAPTGGKVTKGGYPKFTIFRPQKTTTDQKGYFTRTSGSVQFYSPFIEILPPDDLPASAFTPYIGDAFGGTTIAENDQYSFPAVGGGVFNWAGFTQSNALVYPYRFYGNDGSGNGGQISFTGAVDGGGSVTIRFKFNFLPYDRLGDAADSTDTTETYSVVISGATEQTYTIDIPTRTQRIPATLISAIGITTEAEKTNEFNELTMYIGDENSLNGPGTTITFKDLAVTDYT
jgi:hypothetical protein